MDDDGLERVAIAAWSAERGVPREVAVETWQNALPTMRQEYEAYARELVGAYLHISPS